MSEGAGSEKSEFSGHESSTASKRWRSRSGIPSAKRVACAVVCCCVLALDASDGNAGHDEPPDSEILVKRVALDVHLRTELIYQPGWLRSGPEGGGTGQLLLRRRRGRSIGNEGQEAKALPWMRVRDRSFPSRPLAVGGAVRDGLFLRLSLGFDREPQRERVGRPTPSFGVQFERTFD